MRTTVTLDDDVERRLRDEMHRTRRGFKETLNDLLRRALAGAAPTVPPEVEVFSLPLRPGVDEGRLNQLADDLAVEDAMGGDAGPTEPT